MDSAISSVKKSISSVKPIITVSNGLAQTLKRRKNALEQTGYYPFTLEYLDETPPELTQPENHVSINVSIDQSVIAQIDSAEARVRIERLVENVFSALNGKLERGRGVPVFGTAAAKKHIIERVAYRLLDVKSVFSENTHALANSDEQSVPDAYIFGGNSSFYLTKTGAFRTVNSMLTVNSVSGARLLKLAMRLAAEQGGEALSAAETAVDGQDMFSTQAEAAQRSITPKESRIYTQFPDDLGVLAMRRAGFAGMLDQLNERKNAARKAERLLDDRKSLFTDYTDKMALSRHMYAEAKPEKYMVNAIYDGYIMNELFFDSDREAAESLTESDATDRLLKIEKERLAERLLERAIEQKLVLSTENMLTRSIAVLMDNNATKGGLAAYAKIGAERLFGTVTHIDRAFGTSAEKLTTSVTHADNAFSTSPERFVRVAAYADKAFNMLSDEPHIGTKADQAFQSRRFDELYISVQQNSAAEKELLTRTYADVPERNMHTSYNAIQPKNVISAATQMNMTEASRMAKNAMQRTAGILGKGVDAGEKMTDKTDIIGMTAYDLRTLRAENALFTNATAAGVDKKSIPPTAELYLAKTQNERSESDIQKSKELESLPVRATDGEEHADRKQKSDIRSTERNRVSSGDAQSSRAVSSRDIKNVPNTADTSIKSVMGIEPMTVSGDITRTGTMIARDKYDMTGLMTISARTSLITGENVHSRNGKSASLMNGENAQPGKSRSASFKDGISTPFADDKSVSSMDSIGTTFKEDINALTVDTQSARELPMGKNSKLVLDDSGIPHVETTYIVHDAEEETARKEQDKLRTRDIADREKQPSAGIRDAKHETQRYPQQRSGETDGVRQSAERHTVSTEMIMQHNEINTENAATIKNAAAKSHSASDDIDTTNGQTTTGNTVEHAYKTVSRGTKDIRISGSITTTASADENERRTAKVRMTSARPAFKNGSNVSQLADGTWTVSVPRAEMQQSDIFRPAEEYYIENISESAGNERILQTSTSRETLEAAAKNNRKTREQSENAGREAENAQRSTHDNGEIAAATNQTSKTSQMSRTEQMDPAERAIRTGSIDSMTQQEQTTQQNQQELRKRAEFAKNIDYMPDWAQQFLLDGYDRKLPQSAPQVIIPPDGGSKAQFMANIADMPDWAQEYLINTYDESLTTFIENSPEDIPNGIEPTPELQRAIKAGAQIEFIEVKENGGQLPLELLSVQEREMFTGVLERLKSGDYSRSTTINSDNAYEILNKYYSPQNGLQPTNSMPSWKNAAGREQDVSAGYGYEARGAIPPDMSYKQRYPEERNISQAKKNSDITIKRTEKSAGSGISETEMNLIADRIYKKLENRLKQEKRRLGL